MAFRTINAVLSVGWDLGFVDKDLVEMRSKRPSFIHFTKLTGTIGLCQFLRCLINSRVCLLLETIGSVFRQDFIS